MHKASYELMRTGFVEKYMDPSKPCHVLDIGSYDVNGTYKDLFTSGIWNKYIDWTYTGMDVAPGPNVNIVGWDHLMKLNKEWDVIISGQTLEHVKHPWEIMKNIARICRRDTLVCIIVPHTQSEHRYPIDCYRYFPDGLRALFEYVGLEVLECYKSKILHRGIPTDTICIGKLV